MKLLWLLSHRLHNNTTINSLANSFEAVDDYANKYFINNNNNNNKTQFVRKS